MTETSCKICAKNYNNGDNKPMILECGDTLCLACIKRYKEALNKAEFECPHCCNPTKSTTIPNKNLIPKNGSVSNSSFNPNQSPAEGEFEIFIKPKDNTPKFSMRVTKNMTISQLKSKLQTEKGYNPNQFDLAYKRPLKNLSNTLESYGIKNTCTLTQISNVIGGKVSSISLNYFGYN